MADSRLCDTCGYTWQELLLMGATQSPKARHMHTFSRAALSDTPKEA